KAQTSELPTRDPPRGGLVTQPPRVAVGSVRLVPQYGPAPGQGRPDPPQGGACARPPRTGTGRVRSKSPDHTRTPHASPVRPLGAPGRRFPSSPSFLESRDGRSPVPHPRFPAP